jgi:apolipoprotein N-acyltransferase
MKVAAAFATLAAAVVAAALGFGAIALRASPAADAVAPTPVALAQGNLSASSRWDPGGPARTLDAYTRLTQSAFERGTPRLVFWPEAALTFFLEREPAYQRALGRLLAGADAELALGAPQADGADGGPPYHNSVYLLAPDGSIRARYDKQRLLPFMESFPIGIDFLRRRFGRIREFTDGGRAVLLPTRAGPAGVLVCNEAFLPHLAAERVAAGAAYLLNPSNDSWASDAGFAEHQLQLAGFRAVEQRTFVVRVSDSGPSAVIDPMGRVVARSAPGTRDLVLASLGAGRTPSVYGRVGDLFGASCLAIAIGAAVASRRRQPPRPPGSRDATR